MARREPIMTAVLEALLAEEPPVKMGDVAPRVDDVVGDLGIDDPAPRTINRSMDDLVALGWLARNHPRGRKYYPGERARRCLNLPDRWVAKTLRDLARRGDDGDDLEDDLAALDLPGADGVVAERRAAVRACVEFLRDEGEAQKSDFVDEVYPDHPAGYSSGGAWWNVVGKQGFREVARRREDVEAPAAGGRTWTARNSASGA